MVKQYDEDFKKSSVELFHKSSKGAKSFAKELGVPSSTLRGWLDKYSDIHPEGISDKDQVAIYRKRLSELQMENELLKKTIAIFSKRLV